MGQRVYNFNPGPAVLPLPVLERIQAEMLDYKGTGVSILETSHRAPEYDEAHQSAKARTRRLLNLSDNFEVLFMTGGASMQFVLTAMNFCGDKQPAFIDTGVWSTKAIEQATILGKNPNVIASSADRNFCYIPKDYQVPDDAAYLYITSNNTIKGTQWSDYPEVNVPLIGDFCSDILSKPFEAERFGVIFAGAQKNLAPAGVTLALVRKDMLERCPDGLPSLLDYRTYAQKDSLYNTAPVFAIYAMELVLAWLEDEIGGLGKMFEINSRKASKLYAALDDSGGFYRGTADAEDRSLMNVTFRLETEDLEKKFIAQGLEAGLKGLKGHRSVGGIRASIYNAMPEAGVDALIEFMNHFAAKNG